MGDRDSGDAMGERAGAGLEWFAVAELDELGDGRVQTAVCGRRTVALSRVGDAVGALENRCPHQGGPLAEGSIEDGWLRCPWHGYDYDPVTGRPPKGFADAPVAFEVEIRGASVWVGVPPPVVHRRDVSDVVAETLVAWGIDTVFGMVGHSNLGFADALRRQVDEGTLTYIGIRHEGAAAFAASAYGKLTGRPAACFAIAGPGSTNLLTGLYDAKVDRAPVLAISGQVASSVRGRGAFQDLDLVAAFSDVAAWQAVLSAGSDHAELATLACKHALDERTVTHLILPDEVQVQPAPDVASSGPAGRLAARAIEPPAAAVDDAVVLLERARRPVIVVGHGARRGRDDIVALAEHLGAPVLTTFKAKGMVADDHPLGAGVLGRSGTPVASWLMNEADLLVVFGASFSNHTGIAPYKSIVQIDTDLSALGRFHPVTVGVQGDVAVTASLLRDRLADRSVRVDQRADVARRWSIWRAEKERRLADDRGHGVSSAAVFDALSRSAPADAIFTVDVGNHAYSFGRYFESKGQPVLMSGYLGSIGFGFPAAMGAWAAEPTRPIIAVTGDGGFGQYLAELTTAVRYQMDITHVLLDNGELAKISKEQRALLQTPWETGLTNPDFAAYAELCGAHGRTVHRSGDLDDALHDALARPGPSLVHVKTDASLV